MEGWNITIISACTNTEKHNKETFSRHFRNNVMRLQTVKRENVSLSIQTVWCHANMILTWHILHTQHISVLIGCLSHVGVWRGGDKHVLVSYLDLNLPPEACLPEAGHILYRRGKLGMWSLSVLKGRPQRSERRPSYLEKNRSKESFYMEVKRCSVASFWVEKMLYHKRHQTMIRKLQI